MENLIFLNPIFWIVSFLLWLIYLFLYYKSKNNAMEFAFIKDIESIFWNFRKYFIINLILIFLIITFTSLLIANPNLKQKKQTIIKNWIDISIVLDLSYSMMAEDLKPNRLEVAKEVISNFTKQLTTDRVWFVVFSWKPFTSVPLTFDYEFITKYIKNISIKTINQDYWYLQWTAIWEWLLYWANLFDSNISQTDKNQDKREKIIVLLSDWKPECGDFDGDWKMDCIDPIEAVKYLKTKNIKVHTVWIWWEWEVYVRFKNWTKREVNFDKEAEDNLKAIASLTWWKYYRADNKETFEKIFENLNLLQKKEIKIENYEFLTPFYKFFVYTIFYLILIFSLFNLYYFLRK